MTVQDNSIIKPTPSAELLAEKREMETGFAPVTYKAADSFSEFIDMLKR